jgi:hypothetical protein
MTTSGNALKMPATHSRRGDDLSWSDASVVHCSAGRLLASGSCRSDTRHQAAAPRATLDAGGCVPGPGGVGVSPVGGKFVYPFS